MIYDQHCYFHLSFIFKVTDPTALHNFVSTGVVNEQNEVIACYVGDFNRVQKQYEAIVKLKFMCDRDVEKYITTEKKLLKENGVRKPIVFRSKRQRLHDVFFKDTGYCGELEEFDCFIGLPSDNSNHPFMSPKMKIIDVPRYEHFDNHESPEQSDYFMYGDMKNVFLFHIPTKSSDFYQVTTLGWSSILYHYHHHYHFFFFLLYVRSDTKSFESFQAINITPCQFISHLSITVFILK